MSSPNMKFWHVIVMEGYNTVVDVKHVTVQKANDHLKEMKEKYPAPKYAVTKENF